MIKEFVARDGTDHGENEVTLATKVDQIRRQLDQVKFKLLHVRHRRPRQPFRPTESPGGFAEFPYAFRQRHLGSRHSLAPALVQMEARAGGMMV